METIEHLIGSLDDPWKSLCSDILSNDDGIIWAMVTDSFDSCCQCLKGQFVPFTGLSVLQHSPISVMIDDRIQDLHRFDWIGFSGFNFDGSAFQPKKGCTLWKVPNFTKGSEFSFVHLFSGAFNGWDRAVQFMRATNIIDVKKTIAVDFDSEVMRVWCAGKGINPCNQIDVNFQAPEVVGSQSAVSDFDSINCCRCDDLAFTLSPPCVSWSNAGLKGGLHSEHGIAFLEAAAKIRVVRPVCFFIECSDSTTNHKHFPVVRGILKHAGYKMAWSNISNIADMCGMHRCRWLSIWFRLDVEAHMTNGTLKFFDAEGIRWDDRGFHFQIPTCIKDQLHLTPELLNIYGDVSLLPVGLKQKLSPNPTQEDVLRVRCLASGSIMPTLVAAYTKQHRLSSAHVAAKGLFATLDCDGEGFKFHDPLQFIAMLGATTHSSISVDKQLATAFSHLGNGIAVVHSYLTIVLGLCLASCVHIDVTSVVLKCWQSRVSPDNSIVLVDRDLVCIVPHDRFTEDIKLLSIDSTGVDIQLVGAHVVVSFHQNATLCDVRDALGIECESIRFVAADIHLCESTCLDSLVGKALLLCTETRPLALFQVQFGDFLSSPKATVIDVPTESEDGFDPLIERCFVQGGDVLTATLKSIETSADGDACLFHCHSSCESSIGMPCCIIHPQPPKDKAIVLIFDGCKLKSAILPLQCRKHDITCAFGLHTDLTINGFSCSTEIFGLSNGDVIAFSVQVSKKTKSNESVEVRAQIALDNAAKLGSDEFSFVLSNFKGHDHVRAFTPILILDDDQQQCFSNTFQQYCNVIIFNRECSFICPVLIDHHWAGIEIIPDDENDLFNVCLINFPVCDWDVATESYNAFTMHSRAAISSVSSIHGTSVSLTLYVVGLSSDDGLRSFMSPFLQFLFLRALGLFMTHLLLSFLQITAPR